MAIVLADHQYGKAECRLVHVVRDHARHELRDLDVTTTLRGRFDAAYLDGDQSAVLPTDSQKNTAYAFARTHGTSSVEAYGLALARHFVAAVEPVTGARVELREHAWDRVRVGGAEHDHTWVRRGPEVRTAAVTVDTDGEHVVGGISDLVVLKSTGSEFAGFLRDGYTTLAETHDRVMATSLVARWRHASTGPHGTVPDDVPWDVVHTSVRAVLLREFATVHSLALQQTLWHMGRAVLDEHPGLAEIRLVAPNKHHVLVDLDPFGLDNPGEVFVATDRPYGLVQATVTRDDAPAAGSAWHPGAGLA